MRRFVAVLLLCLTPVAFADSLPLWELGGGIGVLAFPQYRGADQTSTYVLPVPYVIYRGEDLKIDRDSVRSRLFDSDRVRLELSVSGSIPVHSEDNDARAGMPNLDPSLELGPSFNVRLWNTADQRYQLEARLPVRAVIATDLRHVEDAGWISHPELNLDILDVAGMSGLRLGALAGPLFATRRYAEYYYSVAPAYALSDRPAYTAPGGYAGVEAILSLSRRVGAWWGGGFIQYDNLHGASFDPSPLVRRENNWTFGFAVAYVFSESHTRVEADR